jgi:hypothetical protein
VPGVSGVFGRAVVGPRVAVTGGRVYVAWQVSRPGVAPRPELARVDPRTAHVLAVRKLGAAFGQALVAGGSLWVVTASARGEGLLRLRPGSLALTGRWRLGGGGTQGWSGRVLAVAGGGLWVAAGHRLLRLTLPGGRVSATVALPGAASSHVSASSSGTRLVIGEADSGGLGAVELRDPVTGALLASRRVVGVSAPIVAGPAGSGVWLAEATGMLGYVRRLTVPRLAPQRGTRTTGTNGITVWLANRLLWVTDSVTGGRRASFCGDPATGRRIARLVLPEPGTDEVLAIGHHRVFYAAPAPHGRQYVREITFPAGCRAP